MTKEEIIKLAKDKFQANLLDGDDINDCGGAMIRADEVWEVLEEYIFPELLDTYAMEFLKDKEKQIKELGEYYVKFGESKAVEVLDKVFDILNNANNKLK